MSIKRGTKVKFVGKPPGRPDQDSSAKYYVDKYGVQVGDKGTVVRAKNGWWRASFTRQDGSRAVSVPMRYDDIKVVRYEAPNKVMEEERAPIYPPMNENFGFDEPPTPDAVVADMKKEAEKVRQKMLESQKLPTQEHQACARLLKSARERNEQLNIELANYSVSMTELIAELDRVKLRLISARTLMQLKDKTIAKLRGEPSFETWGDWVVA